MAALQVRAADHVALMQPCYYPAAWLLDDLCRICLTDTDRQQHGAAEEDAPQSCAGQRQHGTAAGKPAAAAAAAAASSDQQPQAASSTLDSAAQEAIKVLAACGGAASWSSQVS